MGDVKKIGRKIEKAVTDPIKKVVGGVGDIGQDIIDVTIKPARDITKAGFGAVEGTVDSVGEAASGLGEGISGIGKGLGQIAQSDQFAGALGSFFGLPQSSFMPQGSASNAQYAPSQNELPQKSMLPIILIGGGALVGGFLLLRKK